MAEIITSFRNPLVKRIKRLRQKKYRQEEGAFFVEGLRPVLSAVESGAPVETIVYATDLLHSPVAWGMIRDQEAGGRACVELAADVFASISERDHPVGLGAIVRVSMLALDDLPVGPEDVYVALVEVSEPGNLGTVIRTVDAVGAAGLILVGRTVDPFHPTAVKASMGSLFGIRVGHVETTTGLLEWAAANGLHTVATSAGAKSSYWQAGYRWPVLLVLGSEGEGLPAEVIRSAELAVTIPMSGSASSLNLAVAAGLLLYELRRRLEKE